jgi:hypothetical protein
MTARGFIKTSCAIALLSASVAKGAPKKGLALKYEPSAFVGINATQVTIANATTSFVSDGYNGFTAGLGLAVLPKPFIAFEVDAFYTNRIFGFGSTKGSFNTLQIPVSAQLRFGPFNVGAGGYTALWKFNGQMEQAGSTVTATAENAGNSSTEFGAMGLATFKTPIKGIPLRFEFRAFKSFSDIAKSTELKGSLMEYQFLVGYDVGAKSGSKKKK